MNCRAPANFEWSKRHWSLLITALFLAQMALIFTFSEYHSNSSVPARQRPNIHMITTPVTSRQLAKSFFALDPTLFSLASLHSFSGPAWLRIPPPEYSFPDRDSQVRWLGLNMGQLGMLSKSSLALLPLPLQPGMLPGPKVEQFPFVRPEVPIRTHSAARVTGELASRKTELPGNLRCWPPPTDLTAPLVGNTIVEMAVDSDGEVVAAHVRVRSGLETADAEALRTARNLHFSPLRSTAGGAPSMTWGNLIIEWQTALAPDTNAPSLMMP